MKKLIISISLQTLFLFSSTTFVSANMDLTNEPIIDTKERLYQGIILDLLQPNIAKEIEKFYSKYLTHPPSVYPYDIDVLHVERISGYIFRLKLRLKSVYGPHISVGTDDITFIIGSGRVEIEKFEHIKSHKLPKRYENMIREGYNNPIP